MKSAEPRQHPRFAFYDSGEFAGNDEHPDMPLTYFVGRLCTQRRREQDSPAYFAQVIAASEHSHSFSADSLAQWVTLPTDEHWPLAICARSSEQAVKDGGNGDYGCNTLHSQRHPVSDSQAADARTRFARLVGAIVDAWKPAEARP
jgi:hypothetical protein